MKPKKHIFVHVQVKIFKTNTFCPYSPRLELMVKADLPEGGARGKVTKIMMLSSCEDCSYQETLFSVMGQSGGEGDTLDFWWR